MNLLEKLGELLTGGNKEQQQNQGAEAAPSLQSGVQSAVDAWLGFLDQAAPEVGSLAKGAAQAAGSLAQSVGQAVTGIFNSARDTTKENIQSGNYSVAAEPKTLENHFSDHSDLAAVAEDAKRTLAGEERTSHIQQSPKKEEGNPWDSNTPFESKELNNMYLTTALGFDELNPDAKSDDKFRDAWEITNQYIQDMTQARQLNPNATDEEIRAIAEKNRAGEEQRRSGKYAGSGKGYAELEQLLGENGFITERQHEENIQQGIINAARKMQSGDSPFDQLIQLTRGAPTQENMLAVGQALAALGDEGQQLMAYVQNMTDEDAMRFIGSYAAQNYRPVEMTFDEADKYLNESNPMYTVAKSAQGKTEDFQSAYGNLIDVGKKLGKNIANLTTAELVELGMAIPTAADKIALGMRNLTDAEQQAVMDAMNAPGMEWMQDWLLGMDKNGLSTLKSLTPEQKKQLAEFSGKRQGQLQEASGLFSAYEMTPFAQGLFEEYVKTPEGAAKWAEDAKGTKDEQKARDNLWFVERESKYSEAAGKPDFAKTGKAREDFHSGDAGFDQKYNVINNIDGAADKAGLLADIGGSSSYSVALYNFMTDEEKGIFNSYAHAGAIQEANEYLDYLSYAINERMTQSGAERMQAMGRDGLGGGLVASAVSVPLSLTRGIGYLDQLGQKVGQFFTGRPVEQNSQANMIGRLADSARQGVQEQADWNVNILGQNLDAFDFLYGTLMSGIDSFAAGQIGAALGGIANTAEKAEKLASWTGAAILGGGAAQSAMQETYDRGGNDGQALLMGAIAGANETFWEHFSIGNLVEHGHSVGKKTFGKELKNVLTEAGVNFSEELNTSLANGLAEYILNHDDRDAAQKAREYERLGLTPEEAKAKAQEEFWVSAVMDGVGGALMGGAFGAIENAQSARYTKQVDTAAGRGLSSEAKSSILAMAAADAGSSAAKLAKKYSGKAMTDRQAGEVFRALSTEGAEKIRESLNLDFARQIMSKGGGMDAQAADAITAMLRGENLTGEQVAALAASPEGMEIVDEIFASPQGEANTSSTADAGPDEGDSSGSASRQNDSGGEELEPVEFLPMPEEEGVTSSAADASTYPHPQSARLPNGRSLVSADLSPDETSATGGRQGFVPSEGKALGDGSLSMTPGKETARQERISITLKADEGKAEHRAERFSEEDGTVRVTLEDGRKVDLEETDLDAGQRTVALAAAGMEDQDAAAEMMRMYEPAAGKETAREAEARQLEEEDTSSVTLRVPPSPARGRLLETSQAEEERQARDYAMGFQAEYEAARDGRSVEESKSIYAEMLTGKQREAARIMGERAFAQAEAEARERNAQAAREAGYRTVEEAAGERADDIRPYSAGFGVLFERVNEGMEKGGERVKAMLKLLDAVGKEYGLQFRMHDSLEHGANGKYEAGTNIVHLALDAEAGAITKAASHEGFHFIKQFSPEMAKQITDFVVKKLNSAAGYDLGARVQEVMRQYRDHAGQQLTEEAAIEEIVADSMLDVIGTEENMKSLFRERRSAAEKIAAWISDTYNRFKEILNRLAKTSPEVNALKDDVDYIGRIRDMYRQAMEKAAEAWRQAQAGYSEALSQDEAVQEYRQEMKAATAREDAESSLNSLLKTQFMMHFQGWLKANPGKTEEGLKKYRQALLNYKQKKIALSVALQRQGLDQISKQGVRAASYAADQVMNMNESSEKLSLPASGRTKKDFDYETLVTKPNMTMTQLNELTGTEIEEIVKKGTSDFAHSVLVDIEERHGGSTYVYNKDTNTNIKFNRNSFTHSIHNRAKLADYVTVTQKIDSILENAVAVNETDGDKKIQSNYGTIYIGAATGNNAVHIVRMLVNNKTKGVENYDVLYSIYKTEPKKEDVRTTTRGVGQSHVSGASAAPSEITISDLLKLVKESGELYSIVSKDVSEKMGKTRPYNHKFTDRLRYSLPARSQAQEERAAAETVKQDAELYARMRQDEDARAALLLMNRLHEQTTQGGENALIQAGAFEKRLPEMVRKIWEETATTLSDRELRKGLRTIYSAMEQEGYSVGEILTYAKEFYQRVLEAAPGVKAEMDEGTAETLRILKTNAFRLTDGQKSEIKSTFGSLGDFMRKNFGKMKIRNSAKVTLAEVWRESLTPLNPGLFAEDAAEADMPIILDAFLETANQKKFAGAYGANIGAMSTDGAMNLMLDFYDVPGLIRSKQEIAEGIRASYEEKAKWQREKDKAFQEKLRESFLERYDENRQQIAAIRREAREKVNAAREEYRQKYNERIERARQSKQEREAKQGIINEIRRAVRPLKTMLIRGTDSRHIPEKLRGAMERLLDGLGEDRAIFSIQEGRELYTKLAKWGQDGTLHEAADAAAYDPDILDKLQWLEEHAGREKPLRSMTQEELGHVRDVLQNINKLVTEQNDMEVAGRKAKERDLAAAVMQEAQAQKGVSDGAVAKAARKVMYKEMTPVYFARQIGGTLGDLVMDIARQDGNVGFVVKEGVQWVENAVEKYHVNNWIHDQNHLAMDTTAGDHIELTREMAMTLYAWSERERRNTTQSAAHLKRGGFTYDRSDPEVKKMKGVNFTKSHVLSDADIRQIRNYLTDEQRAFVENMVKFLSENMAEKGNEASMKMFGWKKFGEKWYFPYTTDRNFRGQNSTDAKGQPDRQIKHMGASHALTEYAMNPLKLGNFTEMWAAHVDEMARYSVLAEKLDNLRRVTNYVVAGTDTFDAVTGLGQVTAPMSVKKEIERAYGIEAVQYLEQFLRDANGGAMGDERGFSDKFISLFKKGSVAANMSVVLQQPSAFVRAMSMVNPRYFITAVKKDGGFKATRERMYRYSGVANLKQWGGFDTNTGAGFVDTMLDSIAPASRGEKIMSFVDEWTGKGAEKADEITWVYMYSAVEAEIDDRTDLDRGTEAFNRAVAERFDEVMRFTQVYDSTMAKSEWMRSTSTMDKITTSFMAEPTLWINMLMDAGLDLKNGKAGAKKKAAGALGVFIAGSFVNSLLQSIATALRRKKDEGTTIVEKYLSELAANFGDAVSIEGIASMIPMARDLMSLFQGYDVERADMAVAGNLIDACKKVLERIWKGEMPDTDEWLNLAGMAGNMFGIPARNIIRDVSGIYANTFGGASRPISETSGRDIKYSVLDNTSFFSFFNPWDNSNAAYYDRMEQALLKGDKKQYEELRGYLEGTKQVNGKSIDNGVKERIYSAVDKGLLSEKKAIELLAEQFDMKEDTAYYAIDKWREKREHEGEEEWEYNKLGNVMEAVKAGKEIPKEEKQKLLDHGYTELSLLQGIENAIGEMYKDGEVSKSEAEKMLRRYADMKDADEIYFDFDKWDYQKRQTRDDPNYTKYVDLDAAIRNGKNTEAAIKELTDHGFDMDTIKSHMKETVGDMYKEGLLTKTQAKEKLKKVVEIEDKYTLYWAFDKWDYQLKNAADRNALSWNMWRYLRDAMDSGSPAQIRKTIEEIYVASDTYGSSISSAITSYGKKKYLALYNSGKTAEAAELQSLMLTAYEAAGYKRSSKLKTIQGWIKDQNKEKKAHVKE